MLGDELNTFLPYPDFKQSARCLDRSRLGKQRVECLQILKSYIVPGTGWGYHPATKMWEGYLPALRLYAREICREWMRRGYADTVLQKIDELVPPDFYNLTDIPMPPWLGNEEFHASHRSNLLRKDRHWYSKFGWKEDDTLPYVWPTKEGMMEVRIDSTEAKTV